MEKAYDVKVLKERLSAKGLVHVEAGAEDLYKEFSAWLKESAQLSKTPFDDVAIPMLVKVDEKVLGEIDKISDEV